jgi:6-phosphogluconolactonase
MHERPAPSRSIEPYSLVDDTLRAPRLPHAADVLVGPSPDDVLDHLGAELVAQSLECVRAFGDFHLALSGGSTPEPLYRRLMYDPDFRKLPWRRTHLWIVDERCVSFDHEQSNYRMIYETIVQHADIPYEQVHPIAATLDTADVEYERTLRETLEWREKGQDRLDFVLLGLGADGHTASLFPHSEAIDESSRLVMFNRGGQTPPPGRVTMTFPLINAARFIAVLALGASKREPIQRLAKGGEPVGALPISGVRPVGGELKWYLDAAAAGCDHETT